MPRRQLLASSFFNRSTPKVAQALLGKVLVRKIGKREIAAMITEVEVYVGLNDKASHASRGKTQRTKVMFGKPGTWYVYMIYGMYYCLNIVTEREEYPAAVLIRSVSTSVKKHSNILQNVGMSEVKGPGRVCKYFRIDKTFNNKPARRVAGLWIEDRGIKISPRHIRRGKRIGVDYAGAWKNKPWRFWVKEY